MTPVGGEKRTPMAWQHRDINYHQGGYQDRYGPALDLGVPMRPGPPSTSDRLSHRTDKSWRTQKESHVAAYPPTRPYSTGRPSSRTHSGSSSTTSSSSTDSETEDHPNGYIQSHLPPSVYGYYPGYAPSTAMGYPPSLSQYPGTVKSAKSVPTVGGTWDGEPCPVHGMGPMSLPGFPHPPMMMPGPGAMTLPPKRAASIYDMRLMGHPHPPPTVPMFHTLPPKPPMPGDRRSMAALPPGIPSQFLPPMARPRPLVVSEDGTAEPLPVRSPQEKITKNGLPMKSKGSDIVDKGPGREVACRGGICVAMIVISVISAGLLLGVLLVFIL